MTPSKLLATMACASACACAALALPATALAAEAAQAKARGAPKTRFVDMSSSQAPIDAAGAVAVMAEAVPAKVWKLYPASKWAIVSQVEGGMTGAGACVVTARVMLAPLTVTKKVILHPEKMATTFDTQAGATREQCGALARAKLKEATEAVVSSLVKT